MQSVFLFEAKKLQSFVFLSGKLRDASGASELINHLCSKKDGNLVGLAGRICASCIPDAIVERAAGGVLILSAPESKLSSLQDFRMIWRLAVAHQAPGLEFSDGIGKGSDVQAAIKQAYENIGMLGPQKMFNAPPASPLTRPSPHSGLVPQIRKGWTRKPGVCVITEEFTDLETLAKRQFLRQANNEFANQFSGVAQKDYQWPNVFEAEDTGDNVVLFPFANSDHRKVALVHIDGNGIGQMFQQADPKQQRNLSTTLNRVTRDAVKIAMQEEILSHTDKIVPARPILLGGDDLSLILRADLALGFVKKYLQLFEELSAKSDTGRLTAKAGIVILGAKQPFVQAYELCEALATAAKNPEKSCLSFWRLTDSDIPHSTSELDLQTKSVCGKYRIWKTAWCLGKMENLEALADVLERDSVGRGTLRQIPEVLKADPEQAKALYERNLKILRQRDPLAYKDLLEAMKNLGISGKILTDETDYCPLLDAHSLVQIRKVGRT